MLRVSGKDQPRVEARKVSRAVRFTPGVASARSAVRGQARATRVKGMAKSLGYLMNEA